MSEAPSPAKAKPPPAAAGPDLLVSAAPHLGAGATTRQIMFEVVFAMLPLFGFAIYFYRLQAVVLTAVTVAGCLVAEGLANKIRGRSVASLTDGSAIVTGMILAFSLPPSLNPYMAFLGGVVAIVLAKAVFGGLGQNLFNPAMVGRAFLMICFPAAMVAWTAPAPLQAAGVDATTMATPLYAAAKNLELPSLMDLSLGKVGGCVGETSALAAIIGGLYLVIRRIADWRQPVGVLASVAVFAGIAHAVNDEFEGPLFHLTSGALMFGAFFIATDYVGAPVTPLGRLIFGVGVGALVMLIRLFGAYPEGFMFAILIMNALTPLIERWTVPTPFGGHATA
jgi:electron transport complex protein RnfD